MIAFILFLLLYSSLEMSVVDGQEYDSRWPFQRKIEYRNITLNPKEEKIIHTFSRSSFFFNAHVQMKYHGNDTAVTVQLMKNFMVMKNGSQPCINRKHESSVKWARLDSLCCDLNEKNEFYNCRLKKILHLNEEFDSEKFDISATFNGINHPKNIFDYRIFWENVKTIIRYFPYITNKPKLILTYTEFNHFVLVFRNPSISSNITIESISILENENLHKSFVNFFETKTGLLLFVFLLIPCFLLPSLFIFCLCCCFHCLSPRKLMIDSSSLSLEQKRIFDVIDDDDTDENADENRESQQPFEKEQHPAVFSGGIGGRPKSNWKWWITTLLNVLRDPKEWKNRFYTSIFAHLFCQGMEEDRKEWKQHALLFLRYCYENSLLLGIFGYVWELMNTWCFLSKKIEKKWTFLFHVRTKMFSCWGLFFGSKISCTILVKAMFQTMMFIILIYLFQTLLLEYYFYSVIPLNYCGSRNRCIHLMDHTYGDKGFNNQTLSIAPRNPGDPTYVFSKGEAFRISVPSISTYTILGLYDTPYEQCLHSRYSFLECQVGEQKDGDNRPSCPEHFEGNLDLWFQNSKCGFIDNFLSNLGIKIVAIVLTRILVLPVLSVLNFFLKRMNLKEMYKIWMFYVFGFYATIIFCLLLIIAAFGLNIIQWLTLRNTKEETILDMLQFLILLSFITIFKNLWENPLKYCLTKQWRKIDEFTNSEFEFIDWWGEDMIPGVSKKENEEEFEEGAEEVHLEISSDDDSSNVTFEKIDSL